MICYLDPFKLYSVILMKSYGLLLYGMGFYVKMCDYGIIFLIDCWFISVSLSYTVSFFCIIYSVYFSLMALFIVYIFKIISAVWVWIVFVNLIFLNNAIYVLFFFDGSLYPYFQMISALWIISYNIGF